HFKHTYTVRVKYCLERIYICAARVMTGQEYDVLFQNRYASLLNATFLRSLPDCLEDSLGREYLFRFLVQSFSGDLISFYERFKDFRGAVTESERKQIGSRLVMEFLTPDAKRELMISQDIKNKIMIKWKKIENKAKEIPADIFDPLYEWMITTIQDNSWLLFKSTLENLHISV
ncbi:hypothetical protein RFI_15895, partial [Reticulomyxa filosa]